MKLYKTHFLVKLYMLFYSTEELPNGLCPLFWKILVALIVTPFTPITQFINYRSYKKHGHYKMDVPIFIPELITSVFLGMIYGIISHAASMPFLAFLKEAAIFIGTLLILIVCAIIAVVIVYLICQGIKYLYNKFLSDKFEKLFANKRKVERKPISSLYVEKEATTNFFVEGFNAFMDKNCPRMEWYETKDDYVNSK